MGDLGSALTAWAADRTPALAAQVYAALVDGEILLPVRARVVSEQQLAGSGRRAEKEAELDIVTVELAGGRRVLPAFTSAEVIRRWRIDARPVRSTVRDACRAVLDEGWSGLLIDPATHDFVLAAAAVRALAEGFVPAGGDESVSVGERLAADLVPHEVIEASPALVAALRKALAREPVLGAAWLLGPGPELGVVLRVPLDPAGLAVVAQRIGARLSAAGLPDARRLALAALDPQSAQAVAGRALQVLP